MAKSYVIRDEREYPEYEFREFPKHLGFDADGNDIEVANATEEEDRLSSVVWPKHLGKNKLGKDVVAMTPDEEGWKSKTVVVPAVERVEEAKRGPGRPPKSEAA